MGGVDRRELLGLAAAAAISAPALAETTATDSDFAGDKFVPLWPGTPPGGEGVALSLVTTNDSVLADGYPDRDVHAIQTPGLTVYRAARPNGSSLLIVPGGGYVFENVDVGAG